MWKVLPVIICCVWLVGGQTMSPGSSVQTPLLPEEPPFRCEPITDIDLCTHVGYDNATFPNLRLQETQSEASSELSDFDVLIRLQCSNAIVHMLCAVYAPFCELRYPNFHIRPCKNLCMHVRDGCEGNLLDFSLTWPPHLDCDRYPIKADDPLCYGPDDPNTLVIPPEILQRLTPIGTSTSQPNTTGGTTAMPTTSNGGSTLPSVSPFSTSVAPPSASDEVPSEPRDLQVVSIFFISLGLTWHPPASPNGIITHYTICYSTLCPGSNDLVVLAQDYISGRTYTLDGLSPGTMYNIHVTASTGGGEGTAAIVTSTTTFGVYPPQISGFPTTVQGIYILNIQLQTTYGPISHYKVVVVSTGKISIDTRTEVPDSMLLPASQYQTYYYAAGAIMVGDLQTTFSVGNGQISILNGTAFENVGLSADQPYVFFIRLYSSEIPTLFNDSLVTPVYMFVTSSESTTPPSESTTPHSESTTPPSESTSPPESISAGAIVGAIAGAVAAVGSVTIISISIIITVTRSHRARFGLHNEESHNAAAMFGGGSQFETIPMAKCMEYENHSVSQSFPGRVIGGQQKMEGENDAFEAVEENL